MSVLTGDYFREILKQRYGVEVEGKIKKVSFEWASGHQLFFDVTDVSYHLYIYDDVVPRVLSFKSETALYDAFKSFERTGQYRLEAYIDGKIVKENKLQEKSR